MAFTTGRTRTLTMSGATTGRITSAAVFTPGPPGPGTITFQNNGNSNYSAGGFGCTIYTSASATALGHWNYQVDLAVAVGWPGGTLGDTIIDSGTYPVGPPSGGSCNIDISGSYSFSVDVEEVVDVTPGSVDLQGFANYGGSSAAKDFPQGLVLRYYERPAQPHQRRASERHRLHRQHVRRTAAGPHVDHTRQPHGGGRRSPDVAAADARPELQCLLAFPGCLEES